jgi:O-succinylbenzoic acid--CoA ligase
MTPVLCTLIRVRSPATNDPAIVTPGQAITYTQLLSAVNTCAAKLQKRGVKAGDRIAIVEPNTPAHIIALLALWSLKAVACPVSTRLPKGTLHDQLHQIRARHMAPSRFIDRSVLFSRVLPTRDLNYTQNQPATILFTSGTSAYPKAVLHTIGNYIASAQGANECLPLGPGDRWLLSLPLYHVGGLGILFRCLLAKAAVAVAPANIPLIRSLTRAGITHLSLVPTQLFRLLNTYKGQRRLKGLKLKAVLVGGGPIAQALLDRALAVGLPVYTTYGMTEMASQIATARYPAPVSVLRKRKVKISPQGEILVQGATLCSGYVHGDTIDLPVDKEGWFATGDLGTLDHRKHLTVTGRKDNMFISGGENIQPEEIERYLGHIDTIEDCMVVPRPCEEFGFRPVAFIKGGAGRRPQRAELDQYLLAHLPKFKIPERYYRWPDFSDHTKIKLNRHYLAEIIQAKKQILQEIE